MRPALLALLLTTACGDDAPAVVDAPVQATPDAPTLTDAGPPDAGELNRSGTYALTWEIVEGDCEVPTHDRLEIPAEGLEVRYSTSTCVGTTSWVPYEVTAPDVYSVVEQSVLHSCGGPMPMFASPHDIVFTSSGEFEAAVEMTGIVGPCSALALAFGVRL